MWRPGAVGSALILALLLVAPPRSALAAFVLIPEKEGDLSEGTRAAYVAFRDGSPGIALELFKREANKGEPTAMFAVAALYESGEGGEQSFKTAEQWYRRAAQLEYAPAEFNLGLLLMAEPGRQEEGAQWIRRSALGGWPQAMLRLGIQHLEGQGVAKDPAEAQAWLTKAADQGLPEANFFLGRMSEKGIGTSKDRTRALAYYREAAEGDVVEALLYLGARYLDGGLGEKSPEKALALYRHGADDLGNGALQVALGELYERGEAVEQDYQRAMSWYQRAAAGGFADAFTKLGFLHERGLGVAKDEAKAIAFYKQGAAAGVAVSMFNVALMVDAGRGVPSADPAEATRWMYKAAIAGMPLAQNELGVRYQTGKGVMADILAARAWFEASANGGLAAGQVNLARLQEGDNGLPRNLKAAAELYFAAARQGHPYGMFRLGQMFEAGIGTQPDPVKAHGFYLAAAELGYQPAVESRDTLAKKLSPSQLEGAKAFWKRGFATADGN